MTRIERMIGMYSIMLLWLMLAPGAYAAGDPLRGKQLAVQCFACHGVDGNSPSPVNPKIGGQHEQYLLLALKAYVDGTRPNSLMSGAVLDKSEQDLEDMAAYFAAQKIPAENGQKGQQKGAGKKPGPPRGPGGPGMAMQFNHGERDSEFTSMLARARDSLLRRLEPLYLIAKSLGHAAPVSPAHPKVQNRDLIGLLRNQAGDLAALIGVDDEQANVRVALLLQALLRRDPRAVELVHFRQVRQVRERDVDEDEVVPREPGRVESGEHVGEGPLRFFSNRALDVLTVRVDRELPTDEAHVPGDDGMADRALPRG